MLSIRDNRKSRSKSPGGREHSRSHSRDSRARSPPKTEHKKNSIKISLEESESESEESDHRTRDRRSSKKYYESDSEDTKRRHKKASKRRSESESEESDRHRRKSSSKKYYESDSDDRHRKEKSKKVVTTVVKKTYESESSESEGSSRHRHAHAHAHAPPKGRYEEDPRNVRYTGYTQPAQYAYAPPGSYVPDPRAMVPVSMPLPVTPTQYHDTRHASYIDPRHVMDGGHTDNPETHRTHSISAQSGQHYVEPGRYEYGHPEPVAYKSKKDDSGTVYQTQKGGPEFVKTYDKDGRAQLVEVKPETKNDKRSALSASMSRLAVGGALGAGALTVAGHDHHDGGRPPASPLLEAYRGTYQSISPMPFILRAGNDDDLSDLELSGSDSEREKKQRKHRESDVSVTVISPSIARKRVSFYDPADDAEKIAAALAGTRHAPDTKPLIYILPALSTDDIMALRLEYKKHAKVAGQGINIAKHIKTRVSGNFGKAVYATALGRWESEAYWANSWYQGGASRRELLIESLMGRSNHDIREIKNCFKDKRYGDDLEKCMRAELKADKFRVAILLALEERRMSDDAPIDRKLVERDVVDLYRILRSDEGGETAMIQIIVVRSDRHLKEVMRVFEATYQRNFAREMISKSRNLVGETLAHILNGALNRPMRDALLLHQAIFEAAPGKERAELLISRLVRLHWEPKHLDRVKFEFEKRYHAPVEVAIRKEITEGAKHEDAKLWSEFCIELAKSSSR